MSPDSQKHCMVDRLVTCFSDLHGAELRPGGAQVAAKMESERAGHSAAALSKHASRVNSN